MYGVSLYGTPYIIENFFKKHSFFHSIKEFINNQKFFYSNFLLFYNSPSRLLITVKEKFKKIKKCWRRTKSCKQASLKATVRVHNMF